MGVRAVHEMKEDYYNSFISLEVRIFSHVCWCFYHLFCVVCWVVAIEKHNDHWKNKIVYICKVCKECEQSTKTVPMMDKMFPTKIFGHFQVNRVRMVILMDFIFKGYFSQILFLSPI